jgi:hypothetical protein
MANKSSRSFSYKKEPMQVPFSPQSKHNHDLSRSVDGRDYVEETEGGQIGAEASKQTSTLSMQRELMHDEETNAVGEDDGETGDRGNVALPSFLPSRTFWWSCLLLLLLFTFAFSFWALFHRGVIVAAHRFVRRRSLTLVGPMTLCSQWSSN